MGPHWAGKWLQVKEEVSYQAQRIGHHASLAIWGGNNEVEASFQWFPDSRATPSLFAVNFNTLFVQAVRDALRAVDPGLAYVDTSPSAGIYSSDPYTKRCAWCCLHDVPGKPDEAWKGLALRRQVPLTHGDHQREAKTGGVNGLGWVEGRMNSVARLKEDSFADAAIFPGYMLSAVICTLNPLISLVQKVSSSVNPRCQGVPHETFFIKFTHLSVWGIFGSCLKSSLPGYLISLQNKCLDDDHIIEKPDRPLTA